MAYHEDRHARVTELFTAVCELPEQDRNEVLQRECGTDTALRREVESLLAKDTDPNSFLESPALGPGFQLGQTVTDEAENRSFAGRQVGQFVIKRVIAVGGMAVVCEAEQGKPRRTVALKMMKAGVTSQSAMRRFEFESQILGHLHHPNIAQIHDAGVQDDPCAPTGRVPYFAMEYMPHAQPITEYARKNGLTTRRRLELFVKVCDAVQHGHQRGIIHRDLKPGNILVDESGEPKVIDFGVARSTDSDMAVTTMRTDVGQLIGTLQYMSPEQCQAKPHDVDTRSDVYALGVVLYELLCEQLPYDVSTDGGLPEAVRIIREQAPQKPSTINKKLCGDLETVAVKALEKEPSRRYETCAGFARDVQRFLNNEPIVARPPSAMYQLRKLVARHKAPFAFIAALFVLTVGAGGWMTMLYDQAIDAEHLAKTQLGEVQKARDEAELVTQSLADMLAAVDPAKEGKDTTLRQMLDQAAETIGERFKDNPLVEARLRSTIGLAYWALDKGTISHPAIPQLERALEIHRQVLGEEHENTLQSMNDLAMVFTREGATQGTKLARAGPLLEQAFQASKRVLGEEHPITVTSMNHLACVYWRTDREAEAESLYEQVLEFRKRTLGEDHPDTIITMAAMGKMYARTRSDEAEPLLRQALESCKRILGEQRPRTLDVMADLSFVFRDQRRYEEAALLLEQVVKFSNQIYVEPPSGYVEYLFTVYKALDRFEDAETLLLDVLAAKEPLQKGDWNTFRFMLYLAMMYQDRDRWDEAEKTFLHMIDIGKHVMGERGDSLPMSNLAYLYRKQGRFDEANALLMKVLEDSRRVLGTEHRATVNAILNLAFLYRGQGRYSEAETLFLEALEVARHLHGEDHNQTLETQSHLGELYRLWSRYDQALPLLDQSMAGAKRLWPQGSFWQWRSGPFVMRYGMCLSDVMRYDEAEAVLLEAHEILERQLGPEDDRTTKVIDALVELYEAWDKPDLAEEWRARLMDADADAKADAKADANAETSTP